MKYFLLIVVLLISSISHGQRKREVIDSIHSKRLCIEYPGLTKQPTTKEEFEKSEYVFTGKVIEIIRKETLEASDIGLDGEPMDYFPIQNYWYVFEVTEIFKGKKKKRIKIFSRIYSTISPLLILDNEYLIYARKTLKREKRFFGHSDPYIFCGDGSCHIKYAQEYIAKLKKLTVK